VWDFTRGKIATQRFERISRNTCERIRKDIFSLWNVVKSLEIT